MTTAKRVLAYRRKREGKTNYKKRLSLLKSGVPRLVVRRSNKYLLLQLIEYTPDGDKVVLSLSSKELTKHGFKSSAKSIPASYLTGGLLAKKAAEKKITKAIVDLGLQTHRGGTRIYAAIKGAIDAGLDIPARDEVFPGAARLSGEHLKDKGKECQAVAKKIGITLSSGTKEIKEN